jgi:Fe-S cluster assembly ATP-binding protein
MPLLEIENLHVEFDGKKILKGVDLAVNAGEVHAIMGPNGSGKSTLAYVLAGKDGYEPMAGEVRFDGKNLFDMAPDERAAAGLFLAFQYPLEIPGVATMTFLRTALNAQCKKRGEAELSTPQFIKKVRDAAGKLGIDQDMLRRAVNVGFSGGEKSATRFCRWRCSNRGLRCSIAGRRLPCTTRAPRWIFWRRRS